MPTLSLFLTLALAGQMPLAQPPELAAQQAGLKLVAEVYKADYSGAKTLQEKSNLAKKLLKDAKATKNDAEGQFSLFLAAQELATQVGDFATLWEAVDQSAERFQIDRYQQKLTAAESALKVARSTSARITIISWLSRLTSEAANHDQFAIALKANALAIEIATQAKEFKASKQLTQRKAALEADEQAFAKAKAARQALDSKPTDAAANFVAGQWLCLKREDWKQGLNFLALGSDAALAKVAQQELTPPTAGDGQFELADAWWATAQTAGEIWKPASEDRARYWYLKALPSLSGLSQAKARQRLMQKFEWQLDSPVLDAEFIPYVPSKWADLHWLSPNGAKMEYADKLDALVLNQGALIAPRKFQSIQAAEITLGIPPGEKDGITIAVGPVSMILNWDNNENHFRYCFDDRFGPGSESTMTKPFVLVPGRLHEVAVREKDGNVVVTIDGKQHYTKKGSLQGTITVVTRKQGSLALRRIAVEGISDPTLKPTGPEPNNLY
ncbi:hypothetical protein [Anatilimnocola floriformis]|uniref:hypothetical protein n=1 Tax=Anatilimnocola floriformis TaxID=2948575 RepID=UPI0020C58025|nr:hypothetical protein [Anatilimnocola floriformis]